MRDIGTTLALWRAGRLKGSPTKALLGKLEKSHNAKVEKIQEAKRLELAEARRNFRSDFRRMRREILEGPDVEIESAGWKPRTPLPPRGLGNSKRRWAARRRTCASGRSGPPSEENEREER
jgi:hypothetical protein